MNKQKRPTAEKSGVQTQALMGITQITDHGVVTDHGELVFFCLQPTNIAVLSKSNMAAKIYSLMTFLSGETEMEFICLNSRESYESIKHFLAERRSVEPIPQLRSQLEQDAKQLDRMQVQMATAREFILVVRTDAQKENESLQLIARIERTLKEQSFRAKLADREEVKRILAVYFEQNVTTEKFEDFDGERWIVL